MEDLLLSGMVKDRACYDVFKESGHSLSDLGKAVYKLVDEIYTRDACLTSIPKDLLETYIDTRTQSEKHGKLYKTLVEKAYLGQVSVTNIIALIKEAKTHRLAIELVDASQKRDTKKVEKVLDELSRVSVLVSPGEEDDLTPIDFATLIEMRLNPANLIRLGPPRMNQWLGGGVERGSHIVVSARPETGKGALGATCTQGFLKQGLSCLYITNEESTKEVQLRIIQAALEKDVRFLKDPANAEWVKEKLDKLKFYDRLRIKAMHPGSLSEIDRLMAHVKPDAVILDQLRNVDCNKTVPNVERLDTVTRVHRDFLGKYNAVGMSFVQSGDSAHNKLIGEMNDIDGSKTGVQAGCKVLMFMGVNAEFEAAGMRCFSVVKNKNPEGMGHGHFNLALHQHISKFKDPT